MKKLIIFLVFIYAVGTAAASEMTCGPRLNIGPWLWDRHGETLMGSGNSLDDFSKFELFISKGGTFTGLLTMPNGVSCFYVIGKEWKWEGTACGQSIQISC